MNLPINDRGLRKFKETRLAIVSDIKMHKHLRVRVNMFIRAMSVWIATAAMVFSYAAKADTGTVAGHTFWYVGSYQSTCEGSLPIAIHAPTAEAAGAAFAGKKVSALNCQVPPIFWFYDFIGLQSEYNSVLTVYDIIGSSQYNGATGAIGSTYLKTQCPDQASYVVYGRNTCNYTCPSGQTWQGDRCAPKCLFDSLPDGTCTPKNNGVQLATCNGSNPINGATGNKLALETDYLANAGGALSWRRVYNSLAPQASSLGLAWRGSFDRQLLNFNSDATELTAVRADGKQLRFYKTASTSTAWTSSADVNASISDHIDANGFVTSRVYLSADTNEIETYDSMGLLSSIVDATGATQTISRDSSGQLAVVTDSFGRSLTFTSDTTGRIVSVVDFAGGIYSYSYDSTGMLSQVNYPDGASKRYLYNESANTAGTSLVTALTGIIDESGNRFATYIYEQSGRAISSEHAAGVDRFSFAYSNGSTTIVDPLGSVRLYSFSPVLDVLLPTAQSQPSGAGCSASAAAITYDANTNVSSRTDYDGNKICYAYDLSRNLETKRVEGLAANADCASALTTPPAGSRVTTQQWHPDWALVTQVAEPKKLTTLIYNGQGASCAPNTVLVDGKLPAVLCSTIEQATNDETGAQSFAASAIGTARSSSYTYTTYGRVLSATDPNGQITTYTYYPDTSTVNSNGMLDLGRRGQLASITDPLGHLTQITGYNANSQATTIVDPNGLVTTLSYDLRQRLLSKTVGSETTSFNYDPVGQLTQVMFPDGALVRYSYDAAHRLISVNDQNGNRINYTLDAMGNRINEQARDPNNVLLRNVARVVDALNRVQQVTGLP